MNVTAEQARKLWCPYRKTRDSGNGVNPNCIASRCMFWIWTARNAETHGMCGAIAGGAVGPGTFRVVEIDQ